MKETEGGPWFRVPAALEQPPSAPYASAVEPYGSIFRFRSWCEATLLLSAGDVIQESWLAESGRLAFASVNASVTWASALKVRSAMRQGKIRNNVFWGGVIGLFGGVVISVFATAVLILKGFPDELPVIEIYVTYLGGGLSAGLIIGILCPWIRSRSAATIASMIAVLPITIGFLILISGPIQSWGEAEVFSLVFCSIFFAIFVGKIAWEQITFDANAL